MNKAFSKGFTLIELMIVIAIMGILAAIIIPEYQNYVNQHNGPKQVKVFISPIGLEKTETEQQDHEQKPSVHML